MFQLLKIAAQFVLSPYQIADKASWRAFLLDLVVFAKSYIKTTNTKLADSLLQHVEFIVNNDALFDYIYRLIDCQLQTEEVLFESIDENIITELLENTLSSDTKSPEAIDPIVIITLISRILSFINAIKNK
jgi:hypothetical protein